MKRSTLALIGAALAHHKADPAPTLRECADMAEAIRAVVRDELDAQAGKTPDLAELVSADELAALHPTPAAASGPATTTGGDIIDQAADAADGNGGGLAAPLAASTPTRRRSSGSSTRRSSGSSTRRRAVA